MQHQSADASFVIQIVRERILADLKASEGYTDEQARRIARVTLEALTRNLAIELRARGFDVGNLAERATPSCVRIERDGEDPSECTLGEFLRDNAETLDGADIDTLLSAGRLTLGGGAAPASVITLIRIA
jgi:hypothetical protein